MMISTFKLPFVVVLSAYATCCVAVGSDRLPGEVESMLESHCYDCHAGEDAEAGLDLSRLSRDLGDASQLEYWTLIHDRIAASEMPPPSAEQPSRAARDKTLQTLESLLIDSDLVLRGNALRRLNRYEYENTVRDLFGIHVDVSRLLPGDETEQGFDTMGSALSLSAEQMVLYVEAADLVLDQVFGPPQKPVTINQTVNFATTRRGAGDSERKLDDGVVLFSGAKHLPLYDASLREPGLYRVRVKVRAEQTEEPVVMHVLGGNTGSIAPHTAGFFEAMPGRVTTIEFTDRTLESSDCFAFGMIGGYPQWRVDEKNYKGAGLFIGDIHIDGPIEPWPPMSRTRLLGDVDATSGSIDDIEVILQKVVPQAFRRSAGATEVAPYMALARQALDEGLSFERALRRALKGMLCAAEFLFLEQRNANDALASRLSYFLWSSMPDEELRALARSGQFAKPAVLRRQVERMLDSAKSRRFVHSFTGQWLRLRDIDFTVPDHRLYPEYNQLLRRSMLDESYAFFQEILDRDHNVQNFLNSEFVMINQPLAEFYGISDVQGLDIRRVELPENHVRGGALTQAAVLKVSADGTRTSPVLRGAWILKHLFGTPSPPPPPSIAAVEPDIRGATTIREQLAKHREHESCNRCHRIIDPPGFALESFDVIGAQRTWYRTRNSGKFVRRPLHPQAPHRFVRYRQGQDVDASGTMPDGRRFADIRDYKSLLMKDEQLMVRPLIRQLLAYSLGRQLGFSDRREVETIAAKLREKNYGLRSMIHEIVQSDLFRRAAQTSIGSVEP